MAIATHMLEPLRYQREVADFLRREEPELWQWYSSRKAQAEFTETFQVALLKSSYRLNAQSHPELAEAAEQAKARLGAAGPSNALSIAGKPFPERSALFYSRRGAHRFFGDGSEFVNTEGNAVRDRP